MTVDFAHTRAAAENRRQKASALAAAAFAAGWQAYELAVIGEFATWGAAQRRTAVRRAAGLSREPSVETWQAALGLLDARGSQVSDVVACGVCGWPVRQVNTASGTVLLVDPAAHPHGSVWLRQDGLDVVAVVLAGHAVDRPEEDEPLYRPHARSCPAAKEAAGRRRREAPRCPVCDTHLDSRLPLLDRTYTTHPCCDPREEVTHRG